QFLSGMVLIDGEPQGVHASGVSTPTNALDTSRISLATVKTATGDYRFDRAELSKTKTQETGDYGEADDCPCCGQGCYSVTEEFDDGVIDCRWNQTAGSWTESESKIRVTTSDARLLWEGDWPATDGDCLPDGTTMGLATFTTDGYGNE